MPYDFNDFFNCRLAYLSAQNVCKYLPTSFLALSLFLSLIERDCGHHMNASLQLLHSPTHQLITEHEKVWKSDFIVLCFFLLSSLFLSHMHTNITHTHYPSLCQTLRRQLIRARCWWLLQPQWGVSLFSSFSPSSFSSLAGNEGANNERAGKYAPG